MLYYAEGQVYLVDESGATYGVSVTAKDKVIEKRELDSVTFEIQGKAVLPAGAVPVTEDEVVKKCNISELNPCLFKPKKKAKEE